MSSPQQQTTTPTPPTTGGDVKNQLVQTIKEYLDIENELKIIRKEKDLRTKKQKKIAEQMVVVMKAYNVNCFDTKNGRICFISKTQQKSFTPKKILSLIQLYQKENPDRMNDEQSTHFSEFFQSHIETVEKETIVYKTKEKETATGATTGATGTEPPPNTTTTQPNTTPARRKAKISA